MALTVGINAKEWKENDRGFLVELTAGFRMTFETRRYDFKIYTPFVRFNYLSRPRWALFAEAQGNIGSRDVDGAQCRYYEAGIGLGGTFSITPHLKLVGRYLFMGYSSRHERESAYAGDHDFLLDANVARLQIGLQYLF